MPESVEIMDAQTDAQGVASQIAAAGLQVSRAADELRQAADRLMGAEDRAREAELRWQAADEQLGLAASRNAELLEVLQTAREAQTQAEEHARDAQTQAEEHALEAQTEAEERAREIEVQSQAADDRVREADDRVREAEVRSQTAEERARVAELQLQTAEERARDAELRSQTAEERVREIELLSETADEQLNQGASKNAELLETLETAREGQAEADERARRAEQRLQIAVERTGLMEEQIRDLESRTEEAEARPQVTVIVDDERNALQEAVAADVRRPLTSILGLTLALKHADPQSTEGADMIRQLATNARKLDRLVGEMLAVDQIAGGVFEPNLRRTDLEALVCRVVEESSDLANRDVKVESEHVAVQVDPALTEQIVETLLSNAGRRTAPGNTVWVKVSSDQGGAVIAVDDTGPEVPSGLRGVMVAGLMDEGPAARQRPRGATGLTLLARLAEIHGGRAWVEERPGGGASFRVFLPAEREPHEEPRQASADDRAAARVLDTSDERAVALARALVGTENRDGHGDRSFDGAGASTNGHKDADLEDVSGEVVL